MKLKNKITTIALASVLGLAGAVNGQLIITGVVDGGESGGIPKGAELFATSNIADLSVFSLGRYTNGGSSISSVTQLPSISLNQGDFFYITGASSSDPFFTNNGFTVGLSATVVNINGDDLLQIVLSSDGATALDTFGLPGQGDTDFYQDSIAYRLPNQLSGNVAGLTDASNFSITSWVDSANFGSTFGTYAVPEPSAYALLAGLAGLGYVMVRRRRA